MFSHICYLFGNSVQGKADYQGCVTIGNSGNCRKHCPIAEKHGRWSIRTFRKAVPLGLRVWKWGSGLRFHSCVCKTARETIKFPGNCFRALK